MGRVRQTRRRDRGAGDRAGERSAPLEIRDSDGDSETAAAGHLRHRQVPGRTKAGRSAPFSASRAANGADYTLAVFIQKIDWQGFGGEYPLCTATAARSRRPSPRTRTYSNEVAIPGTPPGDRGAGGIKFRERQADSVGAYGLAERELLERRHASAAAPSASTRSAAERQAFAGSASTLAAAAGLGRPTGVGVAAPAARPTRPRIRCRKLSPSLTGRKPSRIPSRVDEAPDREQQVEQADREAVGRARRRRSRRPPARAGRARCGEVVPAVDVEDRRRSRRCRRRRRRRRCRSRSCRRSR